MSVAKDVALHQYTAVAIEGRALLLAGPPGCGKSSLALTLIDRGAVLVGDDGVVLIGDGDSLIASPPPATRGLLEIRNVGIVNMPSTAAPVALVLRFDADAPRFAETAQTMVLADTQIPCLAMHLTGHAAPVRAEHALCRYVLAGNGGFSKPPAERRGEA